MKLRVIVLAVFCFALGVTSCKKEGPMGPAGPAGPRGATGPAGATGTANVMYSNWFKFTATPTEFATFGIQTFTSTINESRITQAIVDRGTVIVFTKVQGSWGTWKDGEVIQLPFTKILGSAASPKPQTWESRTHVGKIFVSTTDIQNSYTPLTFKNFVLDFLQFRYVIIPGGTSIGGRYTDGEKRIEVAGTVYKESELQAMPYEQLCKLLNVPV